MASVSIALSALASSLAASSSAMIAANAAALSSIHPAVSPKKVEDIKVASEKINRLRDLKTSARDQLMIDPRIIEVEQGHNVRDYTLPENHAHLDELKRSIRENGTINPLWVRYDAQNKTCVLVDGECRLRANLELISEGVEIEAVPTIQVSGGNEQERLLNSIIANTGKPLSKWELGTAFQRFHRFGWSPEKIATKTGYTERFINEAMELSDAPDEVKQLLSSQAVTPSLALAELRANGSAAVQSLQAKAKAATDSGKKGPAKREIAPPKKQVNVKALILSLTKDFDIADLKNGEVEFISVDRKKLAKLIAFGETLKG